MKQLKRERKRKKRETGKAGGYGPGIKVQLVIGFIVPILFLIFIGKFSFTKAESSLISNYEDATLSSISMGSRYLDFGFKAAVSDALQLTLDSSLADYAYGSYANDPAQANIIYNKIQSSITVKEASNSFMDAALIIPKGGGKIMSTENSGGQGFYEKWSESEEGKKVLAGKTTFCWMGSHPFIDEKTGSSEEDYAVSYIGVLTNKAACVVIDISREAILESLKGLNLGVGSLAAFITGDGREISYYNGGDEENASGMEQLVFSDEEFFTSCMAEGEANGSRYITWQGVEYLFMYGRSEVNGSVICAMVPKSAVVQGADEIKRMTDLLVVLACIAVGILAVIISINISISMARIIRQLRIAAEGDLTAELPVHGKSEFGRLSANIMGVVRHMRKLIRQVEDMLSAAQKSTGRVSSVSDRIWEISEHIAGAVKDIDGGVSDQSENVQSCAVMMEQLSDHIGIINENVSEVEQFADSTQNMIREGIHTIDELEEQSRSTTEITEKVQTNIGLLENESTKIRNFVDIINNISKQTNLLSLNASIEAARAGQAGKGFSVVADEIQKLAEESLRAAAEIEKAVMLISQRVGETVDTAGCAGNVVEKQTLTVRQTKKVFEHMSVYMEQLLGKLADISESVKQADEERAVTMEAVENISASSVQTAASSSVVNKTVSGQLEIAETLKAAAEELDCNMTELADALAMFKIR